MKNLSLVIYKLVSGLDFESHIIDVMSIISSPLSVSYILFDTC